MTSPLEAFHLFITPIMIDIMTKDTNRVAQRVNSLWNEAYPEKENDIPENWNPITSAEMNAFIGFLLHARTYRAKLEPLCDMLASEHGRLIFTATMSVNR